MTLNVRIFLSRGFSVHTASVMLSGFLHVASRVY